MGVVPHFEVGYWIRIDHFDRIMTEKDIRGDVSSEFLLYCQKKTKKYSVSLYQENHISCKADDGASGEQAVI